MYDIFNKSCNIPSIFITIVCLFMRPSLSDQIVYRTHELYSIFFYTYYKPESLRLVLLWLYDMARSVYNKTIIILLTM